MATYGPSSLKETGPPIPGIIGSGRAMEEVAVQTGVRYLDIFEPMAQWIQASIPEKLTINGVHLGESGDWAATQTLLGALGFPHAEPGPGHLERLSHDMSDEALAALRHEINVKNRLFFDQWRAVNGYYIYGGRKKPFGVVSFPPEMEQYETLIRERERKIAEMSRRIAASR